jgi:signal-transduction protein with cAMP-binding, CBS, and nucleotidyltransferase domain
LAFAQSSRAISLGIFVAAYDFNRLNTTMELARNLRSDKISHLDLAPVDEIPSTALVSDAWDLMQRQAVGCVLIRDSGVLKGIFTERDLIRKVLATGLSLETPITEVMTPDVVTMEDSQPIISAMREMENGGYRNLPILDPQGKTRGVLSMKQLVSYCIEHYPNSIYNYPPTPEPNSTPEGA